MVAGFFDLCHRKIGLQWNKGVYIDPQANVTDGVSKNINFILEEDMPAVLGELISPGERILSVSLYKVPLTELLFTNAFFHHKFVVFQTQYWSWSIEKNGEGVIVQRSRNEVYVRDCFRQELRVSGPYWSAQLISESEGTRTIQELMDWLFYSDHLNNGYHYVWNNCKLFASHVFFFLTDKHPHLSLNDIRSKLSRTVNGSFHIGQIYHKYNWLVKNYPENIKLNKSIFFCNRHEALE